MILEPYNLDRLATKFSVPVHEVFERKLTRLHRQYRMNIHNNVFVPKYWAETVFYGVQDMIKRFPEIKFGSIIEDKHRLRLYMSHHDGEAEFVKYKLYNAIDNLIIDTIDHLLKGDTKPSFLL